jgi:hypothetical protein
MKMRPDALPCVHSPDDQAESDVPCGLKPLATQAVLESLHSRRYAPVLINEKPTVVEIPLIVRVPSSK